MHSSDEELGMDACDKEWVPSVGLVMHIDLNDCLSHVRPLRYPYQVGDQRVSRASTTANYQLALRLAFSDLPDQIAVAHDLVFSEHYTIAFQ